jgi:mRNA-degrading endonuclease YafQ of YafQ-DinJ toxin-antitoxin module
VRRLLLRSSAFVRAARRAIKRDPVVAADIRAALELLSKDAFQPQLKTHKLRGQLEGSWACSAGYDLRIVFRLVSCQGAQAVLLQTIGTHEEVY